MPKLVIATDTSDEKGSPRGEDTSHLERHGRQWRVTLRVPNAARQIIGKSHLKQSLGTGDLEIANRLKGAHIARLRRQIAEATNTAERHHDLREARAIREALSLIPYAVRRAAALAAIQGEEYATEFADIALGRSTPLAEHLEEFIGDWDYQPKSVLDLRRIVKRLGEYLVAQSKAVSVEAVDTGTAASFMRFQMHEQGRSRKGAAKDLGFLRTYWGWLEDNDHAPKGSSPWTAKLPKEKARRRHEEGDADGGKRPYTDEELTVLLEAPTPPEGRAYPRELTTLAALSGMRLEELFMLRVGDVGDGFYNVRIGKTKNATRRVPIHKEAAKIVARLAKGRAADEYLIDPGAPVNPKTGIRSSAASKSFTRFRRALGIDERPNDKAKSNIDFHSLRRWFIKKAKDALDAGAKGYTPWTIADVVGHDDDGMKDILKLTMVHYPGPSGDEARKACVAAVRLPLGRT